MCLFTGFFEHISSVKSLWMCLRRWWLQFCIKKIFHLVISRKSSLTWVNVFRYDVTVPGSNLAEPMYFFPFPFFFFFFTTVIIITTAWAVKDELFLYNRGQNKVDHSLLNPAYIQLNLAYMKPEMYTFTRVMFWIDTFFYGWRKNDKKSARFPSPRIHQC